jgi:hypothetical protein
MEKIILISIICLTIIILVLILRKTDPDTIARITDFFKVFNPLNGILKKN